MGQSGDPGVEVAAAFVVEFAALRAGALVPTASVNSLPPRERAFLTLLFTALVEPFDAAAIETFACELPAARELDPMLAFRARYGACTAWLGAEDRAWLREQLSARLAANYPTLTLGGAPALALQRFDDQTSELAPAEAAYGRLLSALGVLLSSPSGRPRALPQTSALAAGPAGAPKRGRSVWVNGKEVKMTARDELALNFTVGATVGVIAFLFVYSKLLGMTDMPIALLGGAGAAACAVAGLRLPERQKTGLRNLFNELGPYLQLLLLCVLGVGGGLWLLVTGDFGVGVLVITFCAVVLRFYLRMV